MTDSRLNFGSISPSDLELNENELFARLRCSKEAIPSFSACLDEITRAVSPKFVYRFEELKLHGSQIDAGFGVIRSRALAKNLEGCQRVCLFAVTLGIECDRIILRRSKISASEGFVSDAIASALAESLCDKAEDTILGDSLRRPRFSIGYGDLSLEYQKPFLDLLMADKTVGITLSAGSLMIPTKSITAITGVI